MPAPGISLTGGSPELVPGLLVFESADDEESVGVVEVPLPPLVLVAPVPVLGEVLAPVGPTLGLVDSEGGWLVPVVPVGAETEPLLVAPTVVADVAVLLVGFDELPVASLPTPGVPPDSSFALQPTATKLQTRAAALTHRASNERTLLTQPQASPNRDHFDIVQR